MLHPSSFRLHPLLPPSAPAFCFMISFAFREPPLLKGSFNMAINQDLLEILACPACKAKVELKPDGSGLKCVECHRVYPIRDDIPVMLVDEATIEEGNTAPS